MPVERSAGVIVFQNTTEGRKYLVLRSSNKIPGRGEFWDIPKGVLNAGEQGIEAAMREAKEEAGIEKFTLIPDFKFTARYFTRREGRPIPKFVAVFLAETKDVTVKLSWEHDRFEWTSYEGAQARLTTMRPALESAEKFLAERG